MRSFANEPIASDSPAATEKLNLDGVPATGDAGLYVKTAAEALKSWIVDKTNRLDVSALQLGVEMFARAKKPDPTYLGFAARTVVSPEEVPSPPSPFSK